MNNIYLKLTENIDIKYDTHLNGTATGDAPYDRSIVYHFLLSKDPYDIIGSLLIDLNLDPKLNPHLVLSKTLSKRLKYHGFRV